MPSLKKIFYSFLIFFVVLIVAIVVVSNSSWVIKKAADKFAPDYKISYDDITGNVFTGVKISELKFDGETLTKKITFSWNPSKILYKRVAINEISVEALDVDVVKALIASFPTSEENSSSAPLPVVILVDKVHVDIKSFQEQGILISKTVLDVEDIMFANDEIGIDRLMLQLDTNVTNVSLEASLYDGKLEINKLLVNNIDSVTLEKILLSKVSNSTEDVNSSKKQENKEEMNPLIPREIELKKFLATLKPRSYKTANIDKLEVTIAGLNVDIVKILKNEKNALMIGQYALDLHSDIAQVDLVGDMRDSVVTFDHINTKRVDTLALQTFFLNKDSISYDLDSKKEEAKEDIKEEVKENIKTEYKRQNNLIPEKVVLKVLHTDILPTTYESVKILDFALNVKDMEFDVTKLAVQNGMVEFKGKTDLADIKHKSKIKNNRLLGNMVIIPKKELFEKYELPLSQEAIGELEINLNASKDKVVVDLNKEIKHLLLTVKDTNKTDNNVSDNNSSKPFNVDIDELSSHVVYVVKSNTLEANTTIVLTTPYAKDVSITNLFVMDKNMSYSGEIDVEKLIGIEAKFVKPLNNLNVKYSGDLGSVKTDIFSDGLKGSFVSSDMKTGNFHLETRETIEVDKVLTLPGELNGSKVNVEIDVPLDFAKITPITAKAKISSNISNIDAEITYGETLKAKVTSTIPNDSLLKNFDKNVKWNAISPMVIDVDLGKEDAKLKLKSKKLSSDISYGLEDGKVDGQIKLAGFVMDVKGLTEEKIFINAKVNSMESLMTSVQSFYTLEDLPPVKGALDLSADILELKQVNLSLSSPQIIYVAGHDTEHVIEDVKLVVSADASKVQLKSYQVTYDEMKIFSTKPSLVTMKEENIEISEFWLNDQLKVVGKYNTKTKKGDISTDATKLHIAHKMIDLDSEIHIKTILNEEKTSIKGKVVLLGGDIHYDMGAKTYPSDSDILIVQEMKKEEASPFMDNLSMLINVSTQKPIIYKEGPIDIQAKVDLGIHKSEYGEPMVLGEVVIVKGGSYTFEGKKFVLDRSNIYFTGNPNKPLLDMSIKYKSLNHLITIGISGTPATPIITFSSVPSLNKEQILSIILFDSEEGAGTNSGEDMMKMMGGAMAKSALSDMGIKLDHLAIGSDGSVEVGKKITEKITFIYVNDVIPQVRVKYQHSPRWESVLSADEESNAYDIVYKRDFKSEDFIFSR